MSQSILYPLQHGWLQSLSFLSHMCISISYETTQKDSPATNPDKDHVAVGLLIDSLRVSDVGLRQKMGMSILPKLDLEAKLLS